MTFLVLLGVSLLGQTAPPYQFAAGEAKAPLLVVLPSADAAKEFAAWKEAGASRKWNVLMPQLSSYFDPGIQALEKILTQVKQEKGLEGVPVYVVGGPAVFYVASRAPYLWSAALALGGSPKPAIDTDRVYAGNTALVPVGWALSSEERPAVEKQRQKLITSGYNVTVLETPTFGKALEFLARHTYVPNPPKIDCETGSPAFARCYWITMTQFDPSVRNDALGTTRILGEQQASLDFGGFGYKVDAPGPGVLVEFLPENYSGPLKLGDRIVALSGAPIADAKHYVELMAQVTEEKPVSVTVEREETNKKGKKEKERMRLLTRYQLKKREEVITARLQAQYDPQAKEIVIVSRSVTGLELRVPEGWAPVAVSWNGNPMGGVQQAGCVALSLKEPGAQRTCR